MALARYMVIQALKANNLRDRHLPLGLNMNALCVMLTQISHLIIDCPEIAELDLNPVLAAGENITLLDVDMRLHPLGYDTSNRLAILPYPKELEETLILKNGLKVMLRPILPEDEPKHMDFDNSLSEEGSAISKLALIEGAFEIEFGEEEEESEKENWYSSQIC